MYVKIQLCKDDGTVVHEQMANAACRFMFTAAPDQEFDDERGGLLRGFKYEPIVVPFSLSATEPLGPPAADEPVIR